MGTLDRCFHRVRDLRQFCRGQWRLHRWWFLSRRGQRWGLDISMVWWVTLRLLCRLRRWRRWASWFIWGRGGIRRWGCWWQSRRCRWGWSRWWFRQLLGIWLFRSSQRRGTFWVNSLLRRWWAGEWWWRRCRCWILFSRLVPWWGWRYVGDEDRCEETHEYGDGWLVEEGDLRVDSTTF